MTQAKLGNYLSSFLNENSHPAHFWLLYLDRKTRVYKQNAHVPPSPTHDLSLVYGSYTTDLEWVYFHILMPFKQTSWAKKFFLNLVRYFQLVCE